VLKVRPPTTTPARCEHAAVYSHIRERFFPILSIRTSYVSRDFCELVADHKNIHAEYLQRKSGTTDTNWEDTNVDEIRAYMGVLIYMGLVDLPEIDDYFLGLLCISYF
jgi:hypothetical protein